MLRFCAFIIVVLLAFPTPTRGFGVFPDQKTLEKAKDTFPASNRTVEYMEDRLSLVSPISYVLQGGCNIAITVIQPAIDFLIQVVGDIFAELIGALAEASCDALLAVVRLNQALGGSEKFCFEPPCGPFGEEVELLNTDYMTVKGEANLKFCFHLKEVNYDNGCNKLRKAIKYEINKWVEAKIRKPIKDAANQICNGGRRLAENDDANKMHEVTLAESAAVDEIFAELDELNTRHGRALLGDDGLLSKDANESLAFMREHLAPEKVGYKIARRTYDRFVDSLGQRLSKEEESLRARRRATATSSYFTPTNEGDDANVVNPASFETQPLMQPSYMRLGVSVESSLSFSAVTQRAVTESITVDLVERLLGYNAGSLGVDLNIGIFPGIAFSFTVSLTTSVPVTIFVDFRAEADVQGEVSLKGMGAWLTIPEDGSITAETSPGQLCVNGALASAADKANSGLEFRLSAAAQFHSTLAISASLSVGVFPFGFKGSASIEAAAGSDVSFCAALACPALHSASTPYAEYKSVDAGSNAPQSRAQFGAWAYLTYPKLNIQFIFPGQNFLQACTGADFGFESNFGQNPSDGYGPSHPYGILLRTAAIVGDISFTAASLPAFSHNSCTDNSPLPKVVLEKPPRYIKNTQGNGFPKLGQAINYLHGSGLDTITVYSVADCVSKCDHSPDCNGFVYNSVGVCSFYGGLDASTQIDDWTGAQTYFNELWCKARPSTWCKHGGSTYDYSRDCDGDNLPDHTCSDTAGNFGALLSGSSCSNTWPNGDESSCIQGWHLAPAGYISCDYGTPATLSQCEAAVDLLTAANAQTKARPLSVGSGGSCNDGAWGSVPLTCSAQTGGDWGAHYKTSGTNCINQNGYKLVCSGVGCLDDDTWLDSEYGYGGAGCNSGAQGGVAANPTWCTDYGDYSTEAQRACPAACGLCGGSISVG
mmetsp:Transcript_10070/g.16828  ORF Transcript_10070/g.16828 Transcript_10070/m.16828 type:complete len:936 (-) Transcript_10070:368-3175(-)